MSWANLTDVELQLRAAGLQFEPITGADVGRFRRCRVDGMGREKRGWYKLVEIRLASGDVALVGAHGIYRGQDPGAQRLALSVDNQPLSDMQRKALAAQAREARAEATRRRKAEGDRAALRAQAVWRKCPPTGASGYLARKGIGAHGVRFTDTGSLVVPMHDVRGQVRGLQFILDPERQAPRIKRLGRDRSYGPPGVVRAGLHCLIGPAPGPVLLICEGYATGATLHEASGLPVAVAFDAHALESVARALDKHYPRARIVLCADDDWTARCPACSQRTPVADATCRHCGADVVGKVVNVGVTAASDAAAWCNGSVLVPLFGSATERGDKTSDFNDLQQREGRHVVRAQVEAHLSAIGISPGAGANAAGEHAGEAGAGDGMFPVDVLLRHYALIYSTETVFDGQRAMVLGLGALRSAGGKSRVREWLEHPRRKLVMPENVGFDPAQIDPNITCNLWRGWPTTPKAGDCQLLLELLEYLCGNEPDQQATFDWLLRWIAYPLQHPGAKMSTAVLMHGPEGSGKNFFWGSVAAIYGRYGAQISQTELESQFNGWASGKLFIIGNEVVQRAELYHQQGRLKTMITEPHWMINEKNLPTRQEANHSNFVFLSNRLDIAKLDRNDRRYAVLWTPAGMGETFYQQLREDIDRGAIEALHDYLLRLPLGEFGPHTNPPLTAAKAELIDLSMDSPERFWSDLVHQRLPVSCRPMMAEQLYDTYRQWCSRAGIARPAPSHILLAAIGKQPGVLRRVDRFANPTRMGYLKRRIVYPPGQHSPPAGDTLVAWLARCVEATASAIEDYRAGVLLSDDEAGEVAA